MNRRYHSASAAFLTSFLVVAPFTLAPRTAGAEPCPATAISPAMDKSFAQARAAIIERTLEREARLSRLWNWGWGVGFAAAGVGQIIVAAEPSLSLVQIHREERKGLYVGGVKSLIAAGAGFIVPLRVVQPSTSREKSSDPCIALAEAERALLLSVKRQRRHRMLGHIGSLGLNLGGTLVLGVGYGLWREAFISIGIGLVFGLAKSYTQPKGAIRLLRRHRRNDLVRGLELGPTSSGARANAGALELERKVHRRAWTVVPSAGRSWVGLAVRGEL